MKIILYFNTLRFLRFSQIIFLIINRLYRPNHKEVKLTPKNRKQIHRFLSPCKKRTLKESNFFFNYFKKDGPLEDIDWHNKSFNKLEIYNLHYFNEIFTGNNGLSSNSVLNLIDDWIDKNHEVKLVGWDPYPTSLRIVNWIKWDLLNNKFLEYQKISLFNQGLYLEKTLEKHLRGNHLFANAKALIFLGFYFEGKDSDRFKKKGLSILHEQIEEQILSDGGHFELSPMYHLIILEDLLDLFNLFRSFEFKKDSLIKEITKIILLMADWINYMNFEKEVLPCFNDSASNIAPTISSLFDYLSDLNVGFELIKNRKDYFVLLEQSGYVVSKKSNFKMILDVGSIGPDNIPAHSHADTLSFELAFDGERVLVNSGTSTYEVSERRTFERSTKAHNTLEINEQNSSEVWSSFRAGKRAKVFDLKIKRKADEINVSCSHDGYSRYKKNLIHTRSWILRDDSLKIEDYVNLETKKAVSRFIFDSKTTINIVNKNLFEICLQGSKKILFEIINGKPSLVPWKHTTNFGLTSDTVCLQVELENNSSIIKIKK